MQWSPQWFASLPRPKLASLIRPAGYFNQKAKKLQIFSRWLLREYDGSLAKFFRLSTEDCRLKLLSLWGIGPETADSTLLYAGRHPVFVVDAYTKRWLAEVSKTRLWTLRTYDEYQQFFMDRLPHDARLFNEFHALIVSWGKARKAQAPKRLSLRASP
jgi:endonuclease-3 related protein